MDQQLRGKKYKNIFKGIAIDHLSNYYRNESHRITHKEEKFTEIEHRKSMKINKTHMQIIQWSSGTRTS